MPDYVGGLDLGQQQDHDDLVLALALALWYGEKHCGGGDYTPVKCDPILPAWMGKFRGPACW